MIVAVTALYLITAMLCLRAARVAAPGDGAAGSAGAAWVAIGCFFAAVGLWRVIGAEEAIGATIRAALVARGEYALRHSFQRPLIIAALLSLAGLGGWAIYRIRQLHSRPMERALFWAKAAALAMAGLIALRLISFHPTDTLLYSGPHLNRLIDPAIALVAAAQAALFARYVKLAERR
jgi:hypothetical protein